MESIGLPTSETPTLQRDFPRRDSAATARCPVRKYQDERAIASKESTSLADRVSGKRKRRKAGTRSGRTPATGSPPEAHATNSERRITWED